MTDKVQKIKQEIERRIKNLEFSLENNCVEKHSKLDILGNITTLESLLQFIGSLSEEPASEDLEIEIENYINGNFSEGSDGGMLSDFEQNLGGVTYCDLANLARHFAEWQKQKDQETIELAEDHAMLAGMNKMKEEMMENAVYGYISLCHDYPYRRSLVAIADGLINFEYAEKVKIIIVKEE